jgi:drug/metabolite transporter (DMT)-like permease
VAEICVVGFVLLARADRVRATAPRVLWLGFAGGVLSGLAYGLVLYAKTLAPLGMVSALRETSVVIAALIGVWWFRERPVGRRLIAASVVVAGIVLLVST